MTNFNFLLLILLRASEWSSINFCKQTFSQIYSKVVDSLFFLRLKNLLKKLKNYLFRIYQLGFISDRSVWLIEAFEELFLSELIFTEKYTKNHWKISIGSWLHLCFIVYLCQWIVNIKQPNIWVQFSRIYCTVL